jgi:hypothetical protein
MPRKAPDKVVEHRITLGTYERDRLNKALETQRIQAYTSISTGAGVAALGIGGVYGIYILSKWLGVGDIIENILKTPGRLKNAAKFLTSDTAILYYIQRFPQAATLLRSLRAQVKRDYDEYRQKRSLLEAEYAKFGDPASSYYDPQKEPIIMAQITALDEEWEQTEIRLQQGLDGIVQQFRDKVPFL